ncbi:SusC/RagA family TonB-linked outer membrane protein [Algoriphagus sp. NG3]|uniref:SusC/RagA family TonB-linked outer membrane protein n=1 Tax=Algoriphagus sp. NG3 TaxID=3097546 RepID=UPI002A832662|nr:SusC/RagA family TonB-linked outer membrane protein [Algoriphagus sp. NG3]WPR77693.1 SusC/RagA family TonB-linked outer membrane protein [Algoriphagus sp. NG3]
MRSFFFLLLCCYGLIGTAYAQNVSISGKVVDATTKEPLSGAMLTVYPDTVSVIADETAGFSLDVPTGPKRIIVRFMGYRPLDLSLDNAGSSPLVLEMQSVNIDLGGVDILATGYQEIPKERASGSFVSLDEELINRRVSTNLIDRLEDVTSGLILNRSGDVGRDPIAIRGRSTLGRYSQPLIVIDNFPYDGSLDDINPNDVASITVLRDAAAASIWGARAGNGVIVITTNTGKLGQPLKVSLTANANWIEQADPYLQPSLTVNEFIDMEEQLFATGYYNSTLASASNPAVTPVVETRYQQREGLISEQEAAARIAAFRGYDLRKDLQEYLYRPQLNQQYSLGLSGGSSAHNYLVSLGYDKQRMGEVGNSNNRITLNVKNDFRFLNDRLSVQMGLYGVKTKQVDQNAGPGDLFFTSTQSMYPYARLADANGSPLELTNRFSNSFKREAESMGLLDWRYVPLEEIGRSPSVTEQDELRLNLGTDYRIVDGLHFKALYQYWQMKGSTETEYERETYFARELVNLFTEFDENGNLIRNIPAGGILDRNNSASQSHSARAMLDYSLSWANKWELTSLAGTELKSLGFQSKAFRYYGYVPDRASIQLVDYKSRFPQSNSPTATAVIPNVDGVSGGTDRFYSLFANASLSYHNRYLLTFSARKDASNLFGVDANQRSVPLWSAGVGWTLSEEDFYRWESLPYVKLRLSYGYNGNVDRSLSAYTTAQIISNNFLTQLPYAQIINPPNKELRWERIKITNLGLDMESRNGRVSGTLEFYIKDGIDLIGQTPFAPSSGIQTFMGNTASTRTKGYDLQLESRNLTGGFGWTSVLLLSGLKEEVTEYYMETSVGNLLNYSSSGQGGTYFPVVGRPLFGVYSLPWAGLNPETGSPMGRLDGEASEDYRTLVNEANMESIVYHGPARPTTFGAFRNTFSYKGISVSANISYRFGYFFKRSSVQYSSIMMGRGGHSDYSLRWQEPGDERITQVPSMPDARDSFRDTFYRNSEILVEKGGHVRLQDVRIGYSVPNKQNGFLSGFDKAEVFLYANNLGLLWTATDTDLDPDFGWAKPRKSLAIGIQLGF